MAKKSSKAISLQGALIKSTIKLSAVLAVLGMMAVSVTALYQQNQIFDELINANAHALLGEESANDISDHRLAYLNDELDIEYQILDNQGQILHRTLHAPDAPYLTDFSYNHYQSIWHSGELWRVYSSYDIAGERVALVAQPWEQRLEFAAPIIVNYAVFLLVFLLVLLVGNYLVIRNNVRLLQRLSDELDTRHLQNLSPMTPAVIISETKPLIAAINQLFERLTIARQNQERFVADASHELRTPLAAVQMKLQLLARRFADTPELPEQIEAVRGDVVRATSMVESLLQLARLDNAMEMQHLSSSMLSAQALIEMAVSETQPMLQASGVTVIPTYQTQADVQIKAQKDLLLIALRNLLQNACRYAKSQQPTITISIKSDKNQAFIIISDNGVGVSDEALQRLSERFFRVLGTGQDGSGLGLSIVAKIMQYHGGTLDFSHTKGGGLTVTLGLPTS